MEFSLEEFETYNRGILHKSGKYLRGKCYLHGGDNQLSGQYNPETGHYKCHQCGVYGYGDDHPRSGRASSFSSFSNFPRQPERPAVKPVRDDLADLLTSYQALLPGSPGEHYLKKRGISLVLAQTHGLGYARPGTWTGRRECSAWEYGGIIVPHHDSAGIVINLYCRLVGDYEKIPENIRPSEKAWKSMKHDHLSGNKGFFNAMALSSGAVAMCEGPLDALSLIAAGYENTVALFGVTGLSGRWDWVTASTLTFCFDNDGGGRKWEQLAAEAYNRKKQVFYLEPALFGACKDLNEVWIKMGTIDISGIPVASEPSPCKEPEPSEAVPSPRRDLPLDMYEPETSSRGQPAAPLSYDADTTELIAWFCEHIEGLPTASFKLDEASTVINPAGFYAALEIDIAAGPEYIRARGGHLKSDLEKLKVVYMKGMASR